MENIYCICCNNVMDYFLILSETNSINVCNNCFHLQKSEMLINDFRKLVHYDEVKYMKFILKIINRYKNNYKINILNINDNDTNLLDTLLTNMINIIGIPKTYIKTVSLSLNFKPSYFSKHKCYRDTLCEHSIEYLKTDYNSFDIIILNTTLLTTGNPNEILTMCKDLCDLNTNIFVINYHSMNPIDYLVIDKFAKNLFTTNSLKRLCTNNGFELDDVQTDNDNNYIFYKISVGKRDKVSQNIVSLLYDEMNINVYNIEEYYRTNKEWYNILYETNKILDRYKLNKYEIIYISRCKCCEGDNFLYNNNKINYKINDVIKLKEIIIKNINKNININKKFMFIIFNLDEFYLKNILSKIKINNMKYLIYDIKNLITHPINVSD